MPGVEGSPPAGGSFCEPASGGEEYSYSSDEDLSQNTSKSSDDARRSAQSHGAMSPGDTPAVAEVRALLNKRLRVKVVDGRVFEGYLRCFDKKGNIILDNTTERRAGAAEEDETRFVGYVLILPKHRVETFAWDDGTSSPEAEIAMEGAVDGLVGLSLADDVPPSVDLVV